MLLSPLSQLPVTTEFILWPRDLLPEYLWIDALVQSHGSGSETLFDQVLDLLEDLLEDADLPLGFLSDFSAVPAELRDEFARDNESLIADAFPEGLGRALLLYPECPVRWFWPDSVDPGHATDHTTELASLESAVLRLLPGNDAYCARLRLFPFRRYLKAGKVRVPPNSPIPELFEKYPNACTEEERHTVEACCRQLINALMMKDEARRSRSQKWAKSFWRHARQLTPCRYPEPIAQPDEDATNDVWEAIESARTQNRKILDEYMDVLSMDLALDLYDPAKDETVLGLFARLVRLYTVLLNDPLLWAVDLAKIMLRCLVDTAITLLYLVKYRNNDQLFRDFVAYGEGQEKLLMLHLQDSYPGSTGPSSESEREISESLGGGLAVEAIDINLDKSWTKKNARQMADATGMMKYYRLVYAPTSSDVHGTWSSLKKVNLTRCVNPLHRFHRLPDTRQPPMFITPLTVATEILDMTIRGCISGYGFPMFSGFPADFQDVEERARESEQ